MKQEIEKYPGERGERFMEHYMAIQRRLCGYIVSLVPDTVVVDDIIQETVMFMWKQFDDFEPGTDFTAWAFAVAKNKIFNHIKQKQQRRRCFSHKTIQMIEETIHSKSDTVNCRLEALQKCIKKLPKQDRDLLFLRYKEGATLKSVAEYIKQSVNTMYSRLYKLRITLMNCVNKTLSSEL